MIYLYLIFLFLGGGLEKLLTNKRSKDTYSYEPTYSHIGIFRFIYNVFLLGISVFYFGAYYGVMIYLLHFCGVFHLTVTWVLSLGVLIKSEKYRYFYVFFMLGLFYLSLVGIIIFFIWSLLASDYMMLLPYLTLTNCLVAGSIMILAFILKSIIL